MKGTAIRHRPWLLLPGVLVLASVASGSEASKPATSCDRTATVQPAPVVATPAPAPAEAGMRAFIDPETGQLGHGTVLPEITPAEDAVLNERSSEPVVTVFPDGSAMVELNGTCQDFLVIELDANGNKTVGCKQDHAHVATTPAAAPQPQDR